MSKVTGLTCVIHDDSTFSSPLHNDWTHVQTGKSEYSQPDIRGPISRNAHGDSTFSGHLHNDWTHVQTDEYSQPHIRWPFDTFPLFSSSSNSFSYVI